MSQIWKHARKIIGKFSLPAVSVERINVAAVAAPKEVADHWARSFAATFSSEITSATFARYRNTIEAQTLDFSSFRNA